MRGKNLQASLHFTTNGNPAGGKRVSTVEDDRHPRIGRSADLGRWRRAGTTLERRWIRAGGALGLHQIHVGSMLDPRKIAPVFRWKRAIGAQSPSAIMVSAGPRNNNRITLGRTP